MPNSITQTSLSDLAQIALRPYQAECCQTIEDAESKGITRQLVALPTGSGKTIIFGTLARQRNQRTLILAHRDELIRQAVEKLRLVWPGVDVGVVKAERNEIDNQVIVASVQTVSQKQRTRDLPRDFALIITDEAHHAVAGTYQSVYEHLGLLNGSPALHLGVTATPNRTDGVGLGKVFAEVVFERSILDMIQAGYLCDLRCQQIRTEIDISEAHRRVGDYAADRLAPLINTENANDLIIESWQKHAADRRTLAFTVDVSHAQDLAQTFRYEGIDAEAVWGDMPLDKRRAILKDFAAGHVQVVTNCNVLTEGYDNPRIDCIITARPTQSTGLYVQQIGRGTRTHPEKMDCLILDVACVSDQHDLISFPDLFGLKDLPSSETTLIEQLDRESSGRDLPTFGYGGETEAQEVDLFAASRLIWATTDRGYVLNLGKDGRITIYKADEAPERYHAFYRNDKGLEKLTASPVDLTWALGIAESHARKVTHGNLTLVDKKASWRNDPASEKQIAALTRLGIGLYPNLTKGEASDLFARALDRGSL